MINIFPTAHHNSALALRLLAGARASVTRDGFMLLRVTRRQEELFSFQGRLAQVSASALSRDVQDKFGATAPDLLVVAAPRAIRVQAQDEVWAGSRRLRVVAVDTFTHTQQLICKELE